MAYCRKEFSLKSLNHTKISQYAANLSIQLKNKQLLVVKKSSFLFKRIWKLVDLLINKLLRIHEKPLH